MKKLANKKNILFLLLFVNLSVFSQEEGFPYSYEACKSYF